MRFTTNTDSDESDFKSVSESSFTMPSLDFAFTSSEEEVCEVGVDWTPSPMPMHDHMSMPVHDHNMSMSIQDNEISMSIEIEDNSSLPI